MYLDKAKMKEEALHQAGFEDLVPCTEDEIAFLERWLKRPFPQAYREFLHWMGYWGGGLLVGSDFFYERLMNMQEGARALLEEDHYPGELPEDAFVFFMHQGYQFYFFRFSEGADPPVSYYLEDPEKPEQSTITRAYAHFSTFLEDAIDKGVKGAHILAALQAKLAKTNPEAARDSDALHKRLMRREY
jgi:hypothetical protein